MIKNKFLFYLLSCTWGLPMTFVGCLVGLVLLMTGRRPTKYGHCYQFQVGKSWGGVSFGPMFITSQSAPVHIKNHEHGHALQNCIWGLSFPFVIAIPSIIRYWYRKWLVISGRKKYSELPNYDSAWYEGEATKIGTEFMDWYNTK